MTTQEILDLKPELDVFLNDFRDCFPESRVKRDETYRHLNTYVEGQMSDLPRKSVEPIALAAGEAPRTLQEFLSLLKWDESSMRDKIERRVVQRHGSEHAVGAIDETGCPKKGDKTPGVQRQWCGATGKTDNCVVTVHLSYVADDFHCLLDSELYLPESWDQDRERCRRAGIPDDVVYRPKWEIALGLYDKAKENDLHFSWVTFDEGYGGKPGFLRGLSEREQLYVGEVPKSIHGWMEEPLMTERPYRTERRGRNRKSPRIVAGQKSAQSLENHLKRSEELKNQPWVAYLVKEGTKGPMVWEVKHCRFIPVNEDGLPGSPLHLIIARNPLKRSEVKYFLSNAPQEADLGTMLIVAFSRWSIERCFEDEKTELGLDHFEGRKYVGLKRHQTITALTQLFLAEQEQCLKKKKLRHNALSAPHCHGGAHPILVVWSESRDSQDRAGSRTDKPCAA
jgi:SRSO17 transposase